jgi:glyoxylase-like metal-dependent hydrolase (beta-lactamase superfamily II)
MTEQAICHAPTVSGFFDRATNTVSYLVADTVKRRAAVIDPVLDYDAATGEVDTRSVDRVLAAAGEAGLTIDWVLETHIHADHLSGACIVAARTGAKVGIGVRVREVQRVFRPVFGASDVVPDGSVFDRLFEDGDRFALGSMTVEVMHTPGHTPACVSYRIGDAVFVGDTLFMPDSGTARADFPGGDAATLYRSIMRQLALPASTRMFICHDYKAQGRADFAWETSVAEQSARNIHVRDGISEAAYVAMRQARDATLASPALLLPAIQVNMRAGHFPPADADGVRYLRVPVRVRAAGVAVP